MRKAFPVAAFVSALLLSAVVGTVLVNLGRANPYQSVYIWAKYPQVLIRNRQ
jgi:hypothetical protein